MSPEPPDVSIIQETLTPMTNALLATQATCGPVTPFYSVGTYFPMLVPQRRFVSKGVGKMLAISDPSPPEPESPSESISAPLGTPPPPLPSAVQEMEARVQEARVQRF